MVDCATDTMKYPNGRSPNRSKWVCVLIAMWSVSSAVSCAKQAIIAPYPPEALFGLWENPNSSVLIAFYKTLEFKRYQAKSIDAGIWIMDDQTGELMLRPGILTTASGQRLDVRRIFPPESLQVSSLREKEWKAKPAKKDESVTWKRVIVEEEKLELIKSLKQDGKSITQIALATGLSKQIVDWVIYTDLVGTNG